MLDTERKKPHTVPPCVIYGFFALGLASALAFRAIIVFEHIERAWVRPTWYAAVMGYMGFFLYRYRISRKRKRAIEEFGLIEKLRADACLTEDDREAAVYLLTSIKKSPEDLNYFVIFVLSVLAIAADLLFVYLK
jgi:hypothetical protein